MGAARLPSGLPLARQDVPVIRSMTAFASGERTTPWGTLSCELRSVNHRFLEIGTRLPHQWAAPVPKRLGISTLTPGPIVEEIATRLM